MMTNATFHDLNGMSVFITGGASGIGAALTDAFLGQGARVAFVDLADGTEFAAEMEDKHGRAPLAFRGDVTDTAQLQAIIAEAAEHQGPIDVLVGNAANDQRHTLAELTPETWDDLIAVNLKHLVFAAQAVAPEMRARKRGAIVLFTSVSYMMGLSMMPAYTTAKGGITALTRSLARDLGADGIRVNAVAPGMVVTPRQLDLWLTPEGMAAHLERQCLKEHIQPEDMAGTVLFLASEASRMMTGQCLVVDGGVATTG
ncbi:SDR family oxidoreductase [Sulfitobacter sp. D35]|uniref:SDR family NAD(P)-dependent oxidoreductase n=1 Tax=Sulfitobacter sp. D35 TaxID=3083252 RepID=UPI00296E8294|nr:SDR family oxidoreductase [Sulfitobacter sp. D35]MDW4496947.1 SDR family oxidoreductase [Sulfitobacter sp. D35]